MWKSFATWKGKNASLPRIVEKRCELCVSRALLKKIVDLSRAFCKKNLASVYVDELC